MTEAQAQIDDRTTPPGGHAGSGVRPRVVMWMWLGGLALIALVLGVVWSQRQPIAQGYIARSLAQSDVRARYDLVRVGVQTQRIENLVLGDPASPDFTAKWVEVDLGYAGLSPHVSALRMSGARLYGDARGGKLRLGELDKFRSAGSSAPFSLPNIVLGITDSRIRLETDAGPVGMTISGKGNLHSGFHGKVGTVMSNAALAGCAAPRISAYLALATSGEGVRLTGPMRVDALQCLAGKMALARPEADVDLRLTHALDRWSGTIAGATKAVRWPGGTLARTHFTTHFDGDAGSTQGDMRVDAFSAALSAYRAEQIGLTGKWAYGADEMRADGELRLRNVAGWSGSVTRSTRALGADTPLSPLAQQLARALSAAERANTAQLRFKAEQGKGGSAIALSSAQFASASGAHILQNDGAVTYRSPGKGWEFAGGITSSGGGLPEAALRLNPALSGAVAGQMFVKDYHAPGARLAMEPVRFLAGRDGTTRIFTAIGLSGPLADGEVRGLSMPLELEIAPKGSIAINRRCVPLRFDGLLTGSLSLARTALTLCPAGVEGLVSLADGRVSGGGKISRLSLRGSMGKSPMRMSAAEARITLADIRFAMDRAHLVIGKGDAGVRLSAAQLSGTFAGAGVGGQAEGLEAQIATVPLLVREGDARWRYADGALVLDGKIMVNDAATPDRFNPLQSNDFALRMANGDITASGHFIVPRTGAQVGRVNVVHHLGSGSGQADVTVDALRFDDATQPEDITRLALGVVANVRGSMNGTGRVRWTSDSVTSDGTFSTHDMNLAAAFGPVEGLSTTLRFTDLIGLVTAPSQVATIRSVNPGVEVKDGRVEFALLADQRVAVERGHWPFSGGELTLLPSVMDFGADRPRNLTFRVMGLDAGAFINTMELENISATGTFDGLLPMVFDAQGGRIVGGILVARQKGAPPLVIDHIEGLTIGCDRTKQGGMLAYVGQVSNENLGRFGRLAFDALKNLQYKCLTVLMDGAVDGEIVTQVAFNGVNRGELSAVPKAIAQQFIGLPFIFNIKISAPFRGLMNTAKSFVDPSFLIRSQLGDQFQPVRQNPLAVQPRESDTAISGDRE